MKIKSSVLATTAMTLLAVSPISFAANMRLDLLGNLADVAAASRTINIDSGTKYVNVTGGETVRFLVDGKSFAWHFNGPAFFVDLNRVAPSGSLPKNIVAYVGPNPLTPGY